MSFTLTDRFVHIRLSSMMLVALCAFFWVSVLGHMVSGSLAVPSARSEAATQSRMDKLKSMFGFEGFVYALDNCPSSSQLVQDFKQMRTKGARNVITFDYCGNGDDASYYEDGYLAPEVIKAAGTAGLNIIPLVWTLVDSGQSFSTTTVPRINAAVINSPGPVLAVALGDEPLYDNDFGSPGNLAKYIRQMKEAFANAGLSDVPVSISDMAYGWQSSKGISSVVDAVDFFMINNFPYFSSDAESGGSSTSWKDFTKDISYFESIAKGKPLLVTQTGWPSNKDEFAPNSKNVVVSVSSEEAYWNLLDSHCSDFFKAKNLGWMWRSWDDTIEGWGVTSNGKSKWNFSAKTTC
ncbi:hypothetical protein EW145_g5315 [Phellinidium pouzarii]|uniref:glucan endo-1,3-beta-D-glucosidase n=1 Tax=Phellinidium pouzarii TaxID=167371 RepID=A0A4S4L1Q6_9AGAM|nr:hypothetical protein EW145_g5315 [Phellinidium pouzarii]